MDPNYWFNVSRILTLVGGLMTVVGGFGLWHYGQLKDSNTNEKITKSEETAAIANQNAASANEEAAKAVVKSKEIELELVEARKETANANKKTGELELKISKAKAEAEKAKLEREKLLEQQKYIKSISIEVILTIPTKPKDEFGLGGKNNNPVGLQISPLVISKLDKRSTLFMLTDWNERQISKTEKKLTLNYSQPKNVNQIYGKTLEYFTELSLIDCITKGLIEVYKSEIDLEKKTKIEINMTVNGIIAYSIVKEIFDTNKLMEDRFTLVTIPQFKNIPDVVLGNKKINE